LKKRGFVLSGFAWISHQQRGEKASQGKKRERKRDEAEERNMEEKTRGDHLSGMLLQESYLPNQ